MKELRSRQSHRLSKIVLKENMKWISFKRFSNKNIMLRLVHVKKGPHQTSQIFNFLSFAKKFLSDVNDTHAMHISVEKA